MTKVVVKEFIVHLTRKYFHYSFFLNLICYTFWSWLLKMRGKDIDLKNERSKNNEKGPEIKE